MLSFLQPDETTVVSFAVTAEIDQHRVVSKHLRVILTLDIPADRALRPVALYILPDALEAWLRESVDLAEQEEIPLQKLLAAQSWERAYLSLKAFLGDALPVSSVRVADAAIRAAAVIAMGHFTKAAQQEGGDFTMKALCEAVVTRINSRVGQHQGWLARRLIAAGGESPVHLLATMETHHRLQ